MSETAIGLHIRVTAKNAEIRAMKPSSHSVQVDFSLTVDIDVMDKAAKSHSGSFERQALELIASALQKKMDEYGSGLPHECHVLGRVPANQSERDHAA